MITPYRCPTPCDPDCEINGWGCHEAHDVPSHREHDPGACEAWMLAGNLRWLLDNGWQTEISRTSPGPGWLEPYSVRLRMNGAAAWAVTAGAGPGEALARAAGRARESSSADPGAVPCARIGGCLAEIGARSPGSPGSDPGLWKCGCGRDPSMIPASVAQIPWGFTEGEQQEVANGPA